jgi:putative ABC transport system permease protein
MRAVFDSLTLALRSLRASSLRSALTLLGIVIGVGTVVASMAVTDGLKHRVSDDLNELGSDVFQVQKQPPGMLGGDRSQFAKRKNLTLANVELLREHCSDCLRVGGEIWQFGVKLSAGAIETKPSVALAGGTPEFFQNNGMSVETGRSFTEGDVASGAKVIVLGTDISDLLFPGQSPIGRQVLLGQTPYRVIGVLTRMGQGLGGWSKDNMVSIPITSFIATYGEKRSVNITVEAIDGAHVEQAEDQVRAILRTARGVAAYDDDDFYIFTNESMQQTWGQIAGVIGAATSGICLLSLLVGGIGVMNIMLVSVTERTTEVGIRRALGARRRRILAQFLIEAVILAALGGIAGIGLGWGIAVIVRMVTPLPAAIPAWAIAVALITSCTVGLLSGTYPAIKASRLDPVEAMRAE